MKGIGRAVSAFLFVAGVAIVSPASAVQIVDVHTPGAVPAAVSIGSPFTFTHDFTDNTYPNGYTVGLDEITAAELVIVLLDDNGNEDFRIAFGTEPQTYSYTANLNVNQTSLSFAVASPSLDDLSASGTLDVTITALTCTGSGCSSNAFQFVRSTLTAQSITGRTTVTTAVSQNVPEPGTAALIGLAISGLAASRRRRK